MTDGDQNINTVAALKRMPAAVNHDIVNWWTQHSFALSGNIQDSESFPSPQGDSTGKRPTSADGGEPPKPSPDAVRYKHPNGINPEKWYYSTDPRYGSAFNEKPRHLLYSSSTIHNWFLEEIEKAKLAAQERTESTEDLLEARVKEVFEAE